MKRSDGIRDRLRQRIRAIDHPCHESCVGGHHADCQCAAWMRQEAINAVDDGMTRKVTVPTICARSAREAYAFGKADALAMMLSLPQGLYEGVNRYDTDDEHVLHLWRDGESWDVKLPRRTNRP